MTPHFRTLNLYRFFVLTSAVNEYLKIYPIHFRTFNQFHIRKELSDHVRKIYIRSTPKVIKINK